MTPEQLKKLLPNASPDFIALNCSEGIRPAVQQRPEGVPLERAHKRKAESDDCPRKRFEITFRIFSMRPMDWDNPRIKEGQDRLVEAGILPDDNWRILQGRIITEKANVETEERTEITITTL